MKLIIFDLDGVLVDTKDIHYKALNEALGQKYEITYSEHINKYDGLPTRKKLQMLTKDKGLPEKNHHKIHSKKQVFTKKYIDLLIKPDLRISKLIEKLYKDHYTLYCASNAINDTVVRLLRNAELLSFFSRIYSNEDVKYSKPNAEMYLRCMADKGVTPNETLIIEDSPKGIYAARQSKANLLVVRNPDDLTAEKIYNKLNGTSKNEFDLNILIPMAGAGKRFKEAGYKFPKPLIDVNNKPMIQKVVENLQLDANYIFVYQKEHEEKYKISYLLKLIAPNCKLIEIDKMTDGAAQTTLLAEKYIDNNIPLLIANADQLIGWDAVDFYYEMNEKEHDGCILTFRSNESKWSYAELKDKKVIRIAEKEVISNIATCGIYYWKKGGDYVRYAKKMIDKNIRTKGEFYVAPVFNEAIADKKIIRTYDVDKMTGLGTPEDLVNYINS